MDRLKIDLKIQLSTPSKTLSKAWVKFRLQQPSGFLLSFCRIRSRTIGTVLLSTLVYMYQVSVTGRNVLTGFYYFLPP
ncbi:MAG: hypothetical protein HC825_01220 [Oscillatoriales cyanobacterium RM1_1_9]|nr:hypothetical protein [Oscillatoriales cyanobacterium RM1_1_9]